MTARQFLAGLVTEIIFQVQMRTAGKIGLYGLHNKFWKVYTNNYTVKRAGFAWDVGLKKW